jgi:ubiquinone/menaquinone biosynthesis C-methylase UbiE
VLAGFLHYLAAKPWIYDRVQALAGAGIVNRHLAVALQPLLAPALNVLDVGGGTGLARALFPDDCRYVCLDSDQVKLAAFLRKYPTGLTVLADATAMPIEAGSVDIVLCRFLTHHVPDEQLPAVLRECARVLKPTGWFVFVEAIRSDHRPFSNLLWRYDRGSFPRREDDVKNRLQSFFGIESWDRFPVFHEYVVGVTRPLPVVAR